MKVAIFQKYLRTLLQALTDSGASKKLLDDIERTCQELESFRDREFGDLAEFLKRAQQYEAEGNWSNGGGNSLDDLPSLAARVKERVGTPELQAELKSVKKLSLAKLRELAKMLDAYLEGATKTELVEAMFARFNASGTPEALERLKKIKAKADTVDSEYGDIEEELKFLDGFDTDEMFRLAEAFGVIVIGKTRDQAAEAIRRRVFEARRAKEMIAY